MFIINLIEGFFVLIKKKLLGDVDALQRLWNQVQKEKRLL